MASICVPDPDDELCPRTRTFLWTTAVLAGLVTCMAFFQARVEEARHLPHWHYSDRCTESCRVHIPDLHIRYGNLTTLSEPYYCRARPPMAWGDSKAEGWEIVAVSQAEFEQLPRDLPIIMVAMLLCGVLFGSSVTRIVAVWIARD